MSDAGWVQDYIFFFWYWSRDRGGKVSLAKFWLNPGAWGQGKHLTIQLSRLFCIPRSWVSTCVPDVTEGSKDTAYVPTKGEPRGIICWEEFLLYTCQASRMELLHENSQQPQQVDYICKSGPTADVWLDSKGGPGWHVAIFLFVYFGIPKYPCFLVRNMQYLRLGHLSKDQGFFIS